MITLLQYNGSNVTPQDDAILYNFIVQDSGVLFGCTVTHLGAGQLQVADGRGIIQGRNFVIEAQTVQATLAESGTLPGRLIIQVDVANSEEPISFVTQAQNPLPDLIQEDINGSGSIFQLPLATYTAEVTQISGLTSVAHILGNTILPESKGGTGQTSLQAARNAMGLGNTLGVLPVANGGTGQSSLANVTVGNANSVGGVPSDEIASYHTLPTGDLVTAIRSLPAKSCGLFRNSGNCTNLPISGMGGTGYYVVNASNDVQIFWSALTTGETYYNTLAGGIEKGWLPLLDPAKMSAGTLPAGVVATNSTDYTTARLRNIKASTVDLTPGVSAISSGTVYLVYE